MDNLRVWGAVGEYPMVWSRHSNSRSVPNANAFGLAHYWRHSFQWELAKASPDSAGRPRLTLIYPTGSMFTFTEVVPEHWSNSGTSADALRKTDTGFVLQTRDAFQYHFQAFPSGSSEYFLMNRVTDPAGNDFHLAYDSARRFISVTEPGGRYIRAIYSTLTGNRLNSVPLATLTSLPASGSLIEQPATWLDLTPASSASSAFPYQYIRIVQADGSHGNIAEIEIYEAGTGARLSGEIICSDYRAEGLKAFDGDPDTVFRSASFSGGFVGIKLATAKRVGRIRVLPAPGTVALHKPSRWGFAPLKAEGSNQVPVTTMAITRVETSDGRAVDYQYTNIVDPTLPYVFPALTSVLYGDGTRAEYRHTQVFPGTRPLVAEWDDPRYALRQGRYRTVYQSNQTGAVIGAVTSQVNIETGGEIPRIGLLNNKLHQPMVTWANGGSIVQYHGTNKAGAFAITKRQDRNGHITSYTFHPATGYIATEKDPLGRTTSYTYSATGQVATKTYPDGSTESWTHNALGSETSYTDTLGRTTTYTRDALNRVVRINHPDGTHEAFTHNAFGQILTHRLRNGGIETRTYDSRGLLVSVTDPLGNTTRFTYDSADRLATVTDALGRDDTTSPIATFNAVAFGMAANNQINYYDDIVVTTNVSSATGYELWANTTFPTGTPPADTQPGADPDADGIPNLLEYALGGDPTQSGTGILPVVSISGTPSCLTLTFTPANTDGLQFIVEKSSDLSDWSDTSDVTALLTPGQLFTFIDSANLATTPRRFLRLRVLVP